MTTIRAKYDMVLKSLPTTLNKGSLSMAYETAQVDFCRLILIYIQNLHEETDAKGVSLYFNKYDFLQGEEKDCNSLINAWTLKPRKNK